MLFIPGDEEDLDCSSEWGISSELDSTSLSLLLTIESPLLTFEAVLSLEPESGVLIDKVPINRV